MSQKKSLARLLQRLERMAQIAITNMAPATEPLTIPSSSRDVQRLLIVWFSMPLPRPSKSNVEWEVAGASEGAEGA
jgi:hypothetical protein